VSKQVAVVGGGVGGLVAAIEAASHGAEVTLLERATHLGGKMRQIEIEGRRIDVGPTVLTMRWVLDRIFADAGASPSDYVQFHPLEVLARHAWTDGSRLDLFADPERSRAAIANFAGAAEADAFSRFIDRARRIYEAAEGTFLLAPGPSLRDMAQAAGSSGWKSILALDSFRTMWRALRRSFADARLRRLFARYATYYGSSPFAAPATLNLIAHVELAGVWVPEGGMAGLATALERLARDLGVTVHTGTDVATVAVRDGRAAGVLLRGGGEIVADAVVFNGDASALGVGALGEAARVVRPTAPAERSLSALTLAMVARTSGFPLREHNVFFPNEPYVEEFRDIFARQRLPRHPTVYVRAQDRDRGGDPAGEPERLFFIINAPARGDIAPLDDAEVQSCVNRALQLLSRCGLSVEMRPLATSITTPADFNRAFPHSGGALYGRATHSIGSAMARPGTRTQLPGLYFASGSGHPGAGVPMAALSGRQAASHLLQDLALTPLSAMTGMPGGISTASAPMVDSV
jgi:1-hydroxycarotenoid 3,4-desaturase